MHEKITLKQIAQRLDVSIGTVERAIHDKRDINPQTKKRILETIDELGYQPNKFARSLSVKNLKKIAVIIPRNSYFWQRVRDGVEFAEKEMAYCGTQVEELFWEQAEENEIFSFIKRCQEKQYSAIIAYPASIQQVKPRLEKLTRNVLPISFVNDDLPGFNRLFYVGPDNQIIGQLAGELVGKLTKKTGKCIVFAAVDDLSLEMTEECRRRVGGFREVMDRDFPDLPIELCTYKSYQESALQAAIKMITADSEISCMYSVDGRLQQIAAAVKQLNREDLLLVGHEISKEVNDYLQEGIVGAAICQNPFLQGYFSVKCMIEYLIDRKLPSTDKILIGFNIFTKYNTFGNNSYINDLGEIL